MKSYDRHVRFLSLLLIAGATGLVVASDSTPPTGVDFENNWTLVSGKFAREDDKISGLKVITASEDKLVLDTKTSCAGDQELHAQVRLRTDTSSTASAVFHIGMKNSSDPGFWLALTAKRDSELVTVSVFQGASDLHNLKALTEKLDWDCPFANIYYYTLRSYTKILPGWPEDYRVGIEHDMAALPDHNSKWLDVRIELRDGRIRFWVDDRLVATKDDTAIKADGFARIELSPGIQLASPALSTLAQPPRGFFPIRLTGYANAREFIGKSPVKPDSLPSPGSPVSIEGIPFIFPGVNAEGYDHLDIGKSLYREGNSMEYLIAYQQPWGGSALRDPARIQIRIPNGQYDCLYLIAASDEERDSIPLVTATFFRPGSGFPIWFEANVPLATAKSRGQHPSPFPLPQGERESLTTSQSGRPSPTGDGNPSSPLGGEDKGEGYSSKAMTAFPIMLDNGRKANLWLVKIPLDPGQLSALADLDIVEVELTKKMHQFRYYPDPAQYSWHQGGLPSAVHVYAATLGEVPVGFTFSSDKFGHVWTTPETPSYTACFTNNTDTKLSGTIGVTTQSYDGSEKTEMASPVNLTAGQSVKLSLSLPVKLNGYHEIVATLKIAGKTWTEKRSFVRLAPDTRAVQWTEGKGALFGFWSYAGGHYTPKYEPTIQLMAQAGARTFGTYSFTRESIKTNEFVLKNWTRIEGVNVGSPQPWAKENPHDPKKYEAYQKQALDEFGQFEKGVPEKYRADYMAIFGEAVISDRLTSGNYPEYWGEQPYEYTPEEKENIRFHSITARCIAEAIRKARPDLKILLEWGDPLYVVPLLRAGFPTNLVDGTALDSAGFERLPEQQLHQVSVHRLYELKKEFAKVGIADPLLYYQEGPFFPTEVGALTWREQMDVQDRFTLISMAYGIKRFYSGWFTFDNGDWVGQEHYGGCGIQRRIPYCDPKPAYAAYATMTDKLNEANYDGWLKTGSLTTYCLRFKRPGPVAASVSERTAQPLADARGYEYVYTLWTVRGKRPVILTLAEDAEVEITDAMNNTKRVSSVNKQVALTVNTSLTYVTAMANVVSVEVGAANNSDESPSKNAIQVANLGDGSWHYTSERDLTYENNDFDTARYLGKFSTSVVADPTYPSPYPLPQGEREAKTMPPQGGRPSPTGDRAASSPPD